MTDLIPLLTAAVGDAYRLERELGGGGMSRVFVAEEVALGRRVVIKVLPPELAASVNADRFRREIQLAAQLQHPAIVPLLTAGSNRELLWFAMPFVEGESLRARIARLGAMPLDEAARIWRDLLEALEFAHQRRVVHRDIKPENVMMAGRHAVVMDFGVAKAVSAATGAAGVSGTATQAGLAIGTPAYMAPEQAAGDPDLDGRTDLYAAGLVMYEMLAGKGPFTARTPGELMAAHLAQTPAPLAAARPDAPVALTDLVMQCLAKRPEERPASATALLQRLDAVIGTVSGARTPSATASAAALRRPARRRATVAATLGLVALAGGAVGLRVRQQRAEATAMRAVGLPDSARMVVFLIPVTADPADSIVARTLSATMEQTLRQDRRLEVMGDDRVRDALVDAGIGTTPPSPDSVRLVAREFGAHSYVVRSIARAGSGFVLTAEARATRGDSSLFQVQETAQDAAALPGAEAKLARVTRTGLQEGFGRIERPLPTGELFGTNPEAARLWVESLAISNRGDFLQAAMLLRRALQADSTFGLAWARLSLRLGSAGINANEAFIARRNAMRYIDHVRPESYRRLYQSQYLNMTGKFADAMASSQRGLQLATNANMRIALRNTLSASYALQGKLDLAATVLMEAHREWLAHPYGGRIYVMRVLLELGRVDEARRVIAQLDSAVGPSHPATLGAKVDLAYGLRDAATILAVARRQLAAATTDAERLTGLESYQLGMALLGRMDSATAVAAERRRLYAKNGNSSALVTAAAEEAMWRAEVLGDRGGAERVVAEALRQVPWDTLPTLDRGYRALIQLRAALGDATGARRLLADWERGIPPELRATSASRFAFARGEIALAEGKGKEALAAFRAAVPPSCPACIYPAYARAFDAMGNADSTIHWYEAFLQSVSQDAAVTNVNPRFTARAYKRLGELYEAKGDVKNAIRRYTDFVTLWKDADPALQPAVQAVRARITLLLTKSG